MKEVKIVVDKRTELMSVLLYVSNYRKEFPDLIKHNKDNQYVKDVFETFSKFSNHKAVQLLNEIVENLNFCYDAPYVLATQLNEDFSVGDLKEYPYRSRLKSSPIVLEFLNAIKDFAEKSGFEKFFDEHESVYQKYINKVKDAINSEQLSHFEEFFRVDTKRNYIVNLLPLEARAGSYYNHRDDNFIIYYRSESEQDSSINHNVTNYIFGLFTLCLLRNMIEKNNIKVPKTKEFSDILKSKFTSINNEQYICEVLDEIFKIVFQKRFLNIDDETVREKLNSFKSDDKQRVFKAYEIIQDWQKSNEPLEKYLQKLLDLF